MYQSSHHLYFFNQQCRVGKCKVILIYKSVAGHLAVLPLYTLVVAFRASVSTLAVGSLTRLPPDWATTWYLKVYLALLSLNIPKLSDISVVYPLPAAVTPARGM